MTIRTSLFGGAALGAMLALAVAPAAGAKTVHHHHRRVERRHVVVAQDSAVRSEVDELKEQVQSLEAWKDQETADRAQTQAQVQQLQTQLAAANARADQAEAKVDAQIETIPGTVRTEVAAATPKPGWWADTRIGGKMYYDLTNIDESSNVGNPGLSLGNNGGHSPNGFNFDIKRFYVSVDHKFNDMFSANITTDFLYDSGAGATQIYIKKAYLQAKFSPALIVRVGSADMPWIPFDEGVYGMRYAENTLVDRTKFGTSADWGVHALGEIPIGGGAIFDYAVSGVNGMGYKKPGFIGGANRSEGIDFEGRADVRYRGFVVAVGGYDGKLGQDYSGVVTYHDAQRLDALAAYTNRWFKLGGEYMWANADYSNQITSPTADKSEAYEVFGDITFTPQWMLFGRYDWVNPRETTQPSLHNNYYNIGIQYEPIKPVDFALLYKHDAIDNGAYGDQNFATTAASANATYDEVGLWGQFSW